MSAIISDCGKYRYRLDRDVQEEGIIIAYFGINPSTAAANIDDQTIRKLTGFTKLNNGRKFIVGNVFPYRATNVKELATVDNLFSDGDTYINHLIDIIEEADILVPCW
jgi:hypothetical protein